MIAHALIEETRLLASRVDRSGPSPVVRGVLLCGPTSANRRRYLREAFAPPGRKLYENRPVFLNHAGRGRTGSRYEDMIATIRNERRRADGMPVGDLVVNARHPFAETFLHDAEHNPTACGLSHHVDPGQYEGRVVGGVLEITRVKSVRSVDVVTDPATTRGLFESDFLASILEAPDNRPTLRLAHVRRPTPRRRRPTYPQSGAHPMKIPTGSAFVESIREASFVAGGRGGGILSVAAAALANIDRDLRSGKLTFGEAMAAARALWAEYDPANAAKE